MFEAGQVRFMGEDLTHRFSILRDSDFYDCTGQLWDTYTDSELVYLD